MNDLSISNVKIFIYIFSNSIISLNTWINNFIWTIKYFLHYLLWLLIFAIVSLILHLISMYMIFKKIIPTKKKESKDNKSIKIDWYFFRRLLIIHQELIILLTGRNKKSMLWKITVLQEQINPKTNQIISNLMESYQ